MQVLVIIDYYVLKKYTPRFFVPLFKSLLCASLSICLLWMLSLAHYMIWLTRASMIGRRMSHPTKNLLSSSICLHLILALFFRAIAGVVRRDIAKTLLRQRMEMQLAETYAPA